MKIKDNINLEILLEHGFEKLDDDYKDGMCDDNMLYYYSGYIFNIGHSRRGQFYYIIVEKVSRDILLLATKPDGSGGSIFYPSILHKLSDIIEYE